MPLGQQGVFQSIVEICVLRPAIVTNFHIPADLDLSSEVHCNEPNPSEVL